MTKTTAAAAPLLPRPGFSFTDLRWAEAWASVAGNFAALAAHKAGLADDDETIWKADYEPSGHDAGEQVIVWGPAKGRLNGYIQRDARGGLAWTLTATADGVKVETMEPEGGVDLVAVVGSLRLALMTVCPLTAQEERVADAIAVQDVTASVVTMAETNRALKKTAEALDHERLCDCQLA